MEYLQVCKDGKHKFRSCGEITIPICPYCKTSTHIEPDVKEWTKELLHKYTIGEKKGLSRGKLIDSLPRMPWFSDAIADNINDPDQKKAHSEWTNEDDNKLQEFYTDVGISNHITWTNIAEKMGRSLYAIERQLRLVVAGKEIERR